MLYSFISIRCRLALYSFGVLFIFFCIIFLVNQKVYAEDVPWTSVSNEGERVLFQEQSLVMIEGEKIMFHPHLKGVNMMGKSRSLFGNRITDNVFNNLKKWSE